MALPYLSKSIPIALAMAATLLNIISCLDYHKANAEDSVVLEPILTPEPTEELNQASRFDVPPPPSDLADPGQRSAAASRGACGGMDQGISGKEKVLTALVPFYNSGNFKLVWGKTIVPRPTLWFYVPRLTNVSTEFVLQDEKDKTVYKGSVPLSGTDRVVGLRVPSSAPPLAVGKRYHWFFDLYCQKDAPPVYVEGWIQREKLSPVIQKELNRSNARQRVALLATQGIWYDALTGSIELRQTNPRDRNWRNMLTSVGLSNIATEAITNPSPTQTVVYKHY